MCDYIVMYCLKKRNKYKSFKYQHVEDEVSTDDNLENVRYRVHIFDAT